MPSPELFSLRRRIPTLSLFTGAGGLDLGFHAAGFDIIAAVEIEESYCKTLRANVGNGGALGPSTRIFGQDVRSFDPTMFKHAGVECIIGGPPCQTFSAAGRRSGGVLGTDDERGQLFRRYCEILDLLKPQVFVFENVYGLPGANGGQPWREIVKAFSRLGYTLRAEVLDAADYGVPQHRERLFLVGSKQGAFEFPLPTHGPDSQGGRELVSVSEAIRDLQDASEPFQDTLGGLYGHLLPLVPEGLNYAFFTKEMGHPEPVFAWRSKFHDLLYKVDPKSPVRTIKAQPGKFTGPFHWKNRHFTPSELRRLQSFPDDYELVGTYSKIVEQIGNSVPPSLAEVIAVSVREQLLDASDERTFASRPPGFRSTFRQRQRIRSRQFKEVAAAEIERVYGPDGQKLRSEGLGNETYLLAMGGFFDRRRLNSLPSPIDREGRIYSVEIRREGVALEISVVHSDKPKGPLTLVVLEISGLAKYLRHIESVTVHAELAELSEIFVLWAVVEEALVSRSQFFTLIDIYGHYANRGDTVKINTRIYNGAPSSLDQGIAFFGRSDHCGNMVAREEVGRKLGLDTGALDSVIDEMRTLRFDIRTRRTHPTMPRGHVICTYPFPLLSEKAHVERRVRVETDNNEIGDSQLELGVG